MALAYTHLSVGAEWGPHRPVSCPQLDAVVEGGSDAPQGTSGGEQLPNRVRLQKLLAHPMWDMKYSRETSSTTGLLIAWLPHQQQHKSHHRITIKMQHIRHQSFNLILMNTRTVPGYFWKITEIKYMYFSRTWEPIIQTEDFLGSKDCMWTLHWSAYSPT